MSTTHTNTPEGFDARIKKVQKSHSRLARGYDAKVGSDGLIVFRPKRRRPGIPVRGIVLGLAAFFGFKALVLMQLGDIAYQDRVDGLAAGSAAEKAGAWIMQIDPVTEVIAAQIAPLI
ncbi:hypothetical protein ACEWPM_013890 [Roseovarius sp. S4756]|uniref:hypothetical protein n=1 Tax=Roseovarius maritimus TaxID=3342637 RepID=UPI00372C657A